MQSQAYQEGYRSFVEMAAQTREYFECEPPYEYRTVEWTEYVAGWHAAEAEEASQ